MRCFGQTETLPKGFSFSQVQSFYHRVNYARQSLPLDAQPDDEQLTEWRRKLIASYVKLTLLPLDAQGTDEHSAVGHAVRHVRMADELSAGAAAEIVTEHIRHQPRCLAAEFVVSMTAPATDTVSGRTRPHVPTHTVVACINAAGLDIMTTRGVPIMSFSLERGLLSWVATANMLVVHVLFKPPRASPALPPLRSRAHAGSTVQVQASGEVVRKLHLLSSESETMAELLTSFAASSKYVGAQQHQRFEPIKDPLVT